MKGEELFQLIGEADQKKVSAAGRKLTEEPPLFIPWIRWGGTACLVAAAFALFYLFPHFFSHDFPSAEVNISENSGYELVSRSDPDLSVGGQESEDAGESAGFISMDNVFFNEMGEQIRACRMWYDPQEYDTVLWGEEDILAYYKKDLTPPYIPQGLSSSSSNNTARVIFHKQEGIVEDTVWMGFYHDYYEDGSPLLTEGVLAHKGFFFTASKIGLNSDCIYVLPEDEIISSDIAGTWVTFGYRSMPYGPYDPDTHEPAGYYDLYAAEFSCEGIAYQVVAEQLEAEELVKIVSSIICGEKVTVIP